MVRGEFLDHSIAIELSDTAVSLATERATSEVHHRNVASFVSCFGHVEKSIHYAEGTTELDRAPAHRLDESQTGYSLRLTLQLCPSAASAKL